jgi:peptidoglycan hydrolase-like protein with peptidoglycan-binding domain
VSSRATYWNDKLWNYASRSMRKTFVQELFGGQWVTFAAAWHPGDKGAQTFMATEAWRVCTAPPIAPAPAVHNVPPPAGPPGTPYAGPPPQVSPYPGPGAYASNTAYISRYQSALTWLAQQGHPAWDPGGIDGKYGPKSGAAVRAFQTDNGLKPDGMAGADTARTLDIATGHGTPSPVVTPAVPMAHTTPAGSFPAPVLPYPGAGAWKSNADFISRYQYALGWLSRIQNVPAVDPGATDGKYGPKTAAAVKAFQGLVVPPLPQDGQVGPATAQAIDEAVATYAPTTTAPGAAA